MEKIERLKMYEYKGSISEIFADEIMLYDKFNDEVPPTRLTVPEALSEYIEAIHCTDNEEKYYEKIYKYNNLLVLHEIVIPSPDKYRPAKIITQENRYSKEALIFGEQNALTISEADLEPMSRDEYIRYRGFRCDNPYDEFYDNLIFNQAKEKG